MLVLFCETPYKALELLEHFSKTCLGCRLDWSIFEAAFYQRPDCSKP